MSISAEDLAPLQRTVREGSAMLTEALREAQRLRNQTILCAGIALFICCAVSLAAIQRAGESQDMSMTAMCQSDLGLATIARDPKHQADLAGVTRGMSPDGVRRLPQCRERLP